MDDLESYRRGLRARAEQTERENRELAARARALLAGIVEHLVRCGARRVWLFGSLAEHAFRRGSDIDVAAEGLPRDDALFRIGAELEILARPFAIDLVPIEDARPELARKIERTGELLHG